jgi:hypothetical protein
MSGDTSDRPDSTPDKPGPDEVFCTECGEIIKERAEVCPECGVRQQGVERSTGGSEESQMDTTINVQKNKNSELTDRRQYELEAIASKNTTTVVLVSLVLTPAAYWMLGKKALAVVNFLTFNFFLLGFFIVPIHCYIMINNAQEQLRKAGVAGY